MRHILFLFALISWATCAIAQTNPISVNGQVHPDRVDLNIHNESNEEIQVGFVTIQDEVFPLIHGDTLISGYETINMSIPVESAEYHSYVFQVSAGGNLRTTLDMSETLRIPAKKGKVVFLQSDISGRLHFNASQYYEGGKMSIYDLSGRLQFHQEIRVGNNGIQTNLPAGLYVIVIQKQGISESFKVFIR